jgi:ribose 5-phosphate isomerase A
VAEAALNLVPDGGRVGLGTGRAASVFIAGLAARCREGLRVACVPTSAASEKQARALGLPLIDLDEGVVLDVCVDGADEFSPALDLVKGWGGALVRERIVAAASRKQVILVGPEKRVAAIGEKGKIPVEVIPLARGFVSGELKKLGAMPALRVTDGERRFVTDNGNVILDARPAAPLATPEAAREFESRVLAIAGVVDTGLFLGTAERVLVGHDDGRVETLALARGRG